MPGLSQLKQFNKDLLSLGDEITIRASRGEKPVQVNIPKEVEDKNDSEDFVLGMPEIEAEIEAVPVEEDLSDLVGLATPSTSNNAGNEPAPSFEAPDLSSLLNPINVPDDASAGTDMPDLSMFEEPEEQEEEIIEEEPEEISIADMGLDALLSGGGFDAPEEEPEAEEEPEQEALDINDFSEVEDLDTFDMDEPAAEEPAVSDADSGLSELEKDLMATMGDEALDFGTSEPANTEPSLDDLLGNIDSGEAKAEEPAVEEPEALDDFGISDLDDAEEIEEVEEVEEVPEAEEIPEVEDAESFDAGEPSELENNGFELETNDLLSGLSDEMDFGSESEARLVPEEEFVNEVEVPAQENEIDEITEEPAADEFTSTPEGLTDISDFDLPEIPESDGSLVDSFDDVSEPVEDAAESEVPAEESNNNEPVETFDISDMDFGTSDFDSDSESADSFDLPESTGDLGDLGDLGGFDGTETPEVDASAEDTADEPGLDAFNINDITDMGDFGAEETASEVSEDNAGGDDAGFSLDDMDFGSSDSTDSVEAPAADDFDSAPDLDFDTDTEDAGAESSDAGADSFSLDDMDFGSPEGGEGISFDAEDEIPDYEDSNVETGDSEGDDFGTDENQPLEVFDTTDMEGMDFGIQDTDSQLGGAGGDFEFGNNDDFAMEGEFEIPGFSDVTTAKEEKSKPAIVTQQKTKKGKGKNLGEPDFSEAEESDDLPPNTLSDAQYKQFLKNLSEYPLNVRLAFEDLIVQDEFTDDAEFEVIEKILNKAPARQVASMLEKMLDISIPVPRDFEHRTAEEYEAYKKSLAYQLKNKIIPGAMVGIALLFVAWGIFNFSKNCIYKPLKANKLYKQGYALLQADEYPQSEMKFEEAVSYRINKKWFFNYARGYREHRQYQRAGTMYQRLLRYFKHDKAAGLEYADMEMNELANYERAEEIVRREVLDYHINDADGILKLGDIFLEWGTEKDSAKLENAREQYATLIQLYGSTDLYLSRMMRYFIRSDNLRQVIQMQKTFENKEKALGADDLAELSGYLLDKYYGTLAPADEYLRYEIEGLRGLLLKAVKADPNNPIALYNLAKYFIKSGETNGIEGTLQNAIEKFNTIKTMKKRDIYKYIDSYRLLGEHYINTTDYLQAQEQFAEGISLYTTERDNAGFEGNADIGKLYEDMGNIKYSISGDYQEALMNYKYSVELENDSSPIRYRIGYIQYKNKNYVEALGSFMKAGDGNIKERNLLLAMANTLSLRGDDYAAQGYYNQLIDSLDSDIAKLGAVFPQASIKDYDIVNTYLSASNNYGVTLYKLAKRTGNSALNAQAIVQFQQSVRAWDALTRNQETMVRLGGSNLAEQNIQYITHPIPEFEPSIYIDIAKTLLDNEHL